MSSASASSAKLIEESGIFDPAWYVSRYPDVSLSGLDPLRHYISIGASLQRDPHPLFSASYYLTQIPTAEAPTLPLLHYINCGWKTGLNPHPLFDTSWYLRNNPDITVETIEPLMHFLCYGAFEGRDPHPKISVARILTEFPQLSGTGVNPVVALLTNPKLAFCGNYNKILSHFGSDSELVAGVYSASPGVQTSQNVLRNGFASPLLCSEADAAQPHISDLALVQQSGYFDPNFYLRNNPDVRQFHGSPLEHYMAYGWKERRQPSPLFSDAHYCKALRQPINLNIAPIIHFLRNGDTDNPRIANEFGLTPYKCNELPRDDEWKYAPSRAALEKVTVVIPVYRGVDETIRCIYSVLNSPNQNAFTLVVIDDCSPESDLSSFLQYLSSLGKIILLNNDTNQGFVKSVNKGMMFHPTSDIVLLNSDTEVYPAWLDCLLKHAKSTDDVATVTPFSNNATLCSYPEPLIDNNFQLEVRPSELAVLAMRANAGLSVEIPTGVGYCMLITRKSLTKIGYFDEQTFGLGYGEENDYCCRALKQGFRNLFALDSYVFHRGETSFGASAREKQAEALHRLLSKHPTYEAKIRSLVISDPARDARRRLDAQRLRNAVGGNCYVFICHDYGGGTEKQLRNHAAMLSQKGAKVVCFTSNHNNPEAMGVSLYEDKLFTPNLNELFVCNDSKFITYLLELLQPALIHIHSLAGFEAQAREHLISAIQKSGAIYEMTIHDYGFQCAHNSFIRPDRTYCEEPPVEICQECVNKYPPLTGWQDMSVMHASYKRLMEGAARVIAPSLDCGERVKRFAPLVRLVIAPHDDTKKPISHNGAKYQRRKSSDDSINVVAIGAIGAHKGSDILQACYFDARARSLPLRFVIVGYSDSSAGGADRVPETGPYQDDAEALTIISRIHPDVLFFPSICPETYSFTLNFAFQLGIPALAFDIGAIAERIRNAGYGVILPYHYAKDPASINDAIMSTDWSNTNPAPAGRHS